MQGWQQQCRGLRGPSPLLLRISAQSSYPYTSIRQVLCRGSWSHHVGPTKAAAGVHPYWPAATVPAPAGDSLKHCPDQQSASNITHTHRGGAAGSRHGLRHLAPAAAASSSAAAPVPAGVYWQKIACLGLIFLCGTINHTLLMSLKDGIIVTTCGAEALPFISAVGVLPATLGFFLFYDKVTTALKPQQVFFVALLPHLLFYTLFAGYLLPNAAWLHPSAQLGALAAGLPDSLACFVKVVTNWTYTLFYIVSELWGGMAISLLFWGMADDLCSVEEAKEVYPRLGILANVGLVAAGSYVKLITRGVAAGNETLGLQLLLGTVVCVILIMMAIKSYMDRAVIPHLGVAPGEAPKKKKKKDKGKAKGGQSDTWDILKSSLRIRDLTILVMSYGITNKLFGIVWRGQMRAAHPTAADFTALMSELASWTGVITMVSMCCSKYVFKLLGWRGAALATPLVVGLAGSTFLVSQLVAGDARAAATTLGGLLLAAGPAAGIVTQVFSRASKYSLFDPSKEMVFIAMTDKTEKEKGKAAVDLLGQQVGKSGGSWVLQIALLAAGSMAGALPYTTAVYVLVSGAWMMSTLELARDMEGAAGEAVVVKTIDETPPLVHPTPSSAATLVTTGPDGTLMKISLPDYVQDSASQQKEIKASMQSHFD